MLTPEKKNQVIKKNVTINSNQLASDIKYLKTIIPPYVLLFVFSLRLRRGLSDWRRHQTRSGRRHVRRATRDAGESGERRTRHPKQRHVRGSDSGCCEVRMGMQRGATISPDCILSARGVLNRGAFVCEFQISGTFRSERPGSRRFGCSCGSAERPQQEEPSGFGQGCHWWIDLTP